MLLVTPHSNGSSPNPLLRRRPRPPQPTLQTRFLCNLTCAFPHMNAPFCQLNTLFTVRISVNFQVNKSAGPFDALLCVGQFFPDTPEQLEEFNDYIEGRSKIPIPTYFIGDYGVGAPKILGAAAKYPANLGFKMDGLKVCENLFWLRGSGKFLLHGNFLDHFRKNSLKKVILSCTYFLSPVVWFFIRYLLSLLFNLLCWLLY